MKNKEKLNLIILCGLLFLPACGVSDAPMIYEESDISVEKSEESPSIERKEIAQESETLGEESEQWKDRIYVTADGMWGNILGYSLLRMPPNPGNNMYYEQDMPYLLDEDMVGKGIYISDYMCETEVFLGNILNDVLTNRGAVSYENKQYFTEYALQQLANTNWESLNAEWEPDLYVYDRYYCMNPVSGSGGYQFFYSFYPNQEEMKEKEPAE
ncbi:MAG: hypothetical protein NC321_04050 [Clostridium sp.]|nr:hypothetical protein [Clostridium sp.]